MKPTHAVTRSAWLSSELDPEHGPPEAQLMRMLSLLDGTDRWALLLWPIPSEVAWGDLNVDEYEEPTFIQAGGRSDRLTVEIKYPPQGAEPSKQFIIGREDGDYSGDPEEDVVFTDHEYRVFPGEVLNAADASILFDSFYSSGDVPDGWHRREIVWP